MFQNCTESISQKWKIGSTGSDGGHTIVSEKYDPTVCLDENGRDNDIYQWRCDQSLDQYFSLVSLYTSAFPSSAPTETTTTEAPSGSPTEIPSNAPYSAPSETPSKAPSETPSIAPSTKPSFNPTDTPNGLCDIMNVIGQTLFIAGAGACWRVQLATGGTLERDSNDPSCDKDESDWQSTAGVLSNFDSVALDDDIAVFTGGVNAKFQFKEDPVVTAPGLQILGFNPDLNEYALEITIPTCSDDAMCPTMKVAL